MASSLRVASVVGAVMLYGCVAMHCPYSTVYGDDNASQTVVNSFDHSLRDLPARWVISDWEAGSKSKHNEQNWTSGTCQSALALARRLSCYISYAAILVIGLDRTDIIYPFHFFF